MAGEIRLRLDQLAKDLADDRLAKEAYKTFYQETPLGDPSSWKNPRPPKGYQPGNARRKTILRETEISADYAYARRLDEGWSKQSPKGMLQPTIEAVQRYIKEQAK